MASAGLQCPLIDVVTLSCLKQVGHLVVLGDNCIIIMYGIKVTAEDFRLIALYTKNIHTLLLDVCDFAMHCAFLAINPTL